MKDNKLEIGDILYGHRRGIHSYMFKTKVVRLTPKRAILENGTVVLNDVREGHGYNYSNLSVKIVGEYGTMDLETPKLLNEWKEVVLRNKAKRVFDSIRLRELTIEQCKGLIALFPESTNQPKQNLT